MYWANYPTYNLILHPNLLLQDKSTESTRDDQYAQEA